MYLRFIANKMELFFSVNEVTVMTVSYGRHISVSGKFRRMNGDIPGVPCYVTVSGETVTIEDTGDKRLVLEISHVEISGLQEDE